MSSPGRTSGERRVGAHGPDVLGLVSPGFLAASLLLILAAAVLCNGSYAVAWDLYVRLARGTSGLVQPTLVLGPLICIATVIGLVVLAGLRPSDIGLRGRHVLPGLAATVAVWGLIEAVEIALAAGAGGDLTVNPRWTRLGWSAMVGQLVGQVLGIAAIEEIFFRGYLLRQLMARFSAGLAHRRSAIAGAMLLSQVAFSLYHVPNFVLFPSGVGITGPADAALQLVIDLAIGVLFAALYLRTGNLFLVMGFHSLNNAPSILVAPAIDGSILVQLVALAVVVATVLRPVRAPKVAATASVSPA